MTKRLAALLLILALAGCSDRQAADKDTGLPGDAGLTKEAGSGNNAAPRRIPGGGTADGAIDGRLNVYVVDGHTDKPLVGAFVMVADGATHQGSTDKDGLLSFKSPQLKGPLSLTAALKGYTTTTVVGLNAANLTLNLYSRTVAPKVKTATCKGTISGWSALPKPKKNHLNMGMVHFLLDRRLNRPRNALEQPSGDKNIYAPGPPLNLNAWQVKVPAGAFGLFALVLDLDHKGTSKESDDTYQITHVGVKTGLSVQEGQTLSGVTIPVSPANYTLNITLPNKPAGTKTLGTSVFLELANKELASIFQDSGSTGKALVPKLTGDFAGGNYWAVLSADDGVEHADDNRATESVFLKRGIKSVAQPVAASLLALPANIAAAAGGKLSFTLSAGVNFASAKVMPEKIGGGYWEVLFFKPSAGANTVTLPTLPATVPGEKPAAGKQYLSIYGMDLPGVDMNKANFEDQFLKLSRLTRTGKVVDWK